MKFLNSYPSTGYFPTQGHSVLSRSTLLIGDYRTVAPDWQRLLRDRSQTASFSTMV